jgi:hypothetical protein
MLHCDINVERRPQAAPKFAAGPRYILNRMEEPPFVGRKKRSTRSNPKNLQNSLSSSWLGIYSREQACATRIS